MMTGSVTSLVIVLLLSFLERCHFFHTRFLSQQKKQIYYKGSNNNNNNMPQMDWDPKAAPKLDFSEDYYTILEISDNCNPTQLKKQYYKLVFKYHPDNKQSDEEKELCNRQMMVINNAYKILKDDHTRKQYNNQRAIGNFGTKARVKTQKMDDDSTQSTSNNKSASSKTSTSASASTSSSNAYTGSKSSSSTYSSTSSRGKDDSSFDDFFQRIYDKSSTTTTTRSPSSSSSAQSESVESLGDILSDLWKDISLDGGRNVLEDLVDFLEEKIPVKSYEESSKVSQSARSDGESLLGLENDIRVFQMTISSLEKHIKEMTAERLQLDSYRPGEPTRDANGSLRDVAQLQERLRRIEDMKGLDARMSEAQKQVRALREQIRKKDSRVASIKASGSSQYTGTSTATSTATSSANSATAATGSKTSSQSSFSSYSSTSSGRNDAVEKELMKLKREMKNK